MEHKCPRCGSALKVIVVRVPIEIEADDAPVLVRYYKEREEVSDCVRCTGAY